MDNNNLSTPEQLYFLGPKGEQRKLFQEMIELINNDMIFWRRNFHPKDPPSIEYKTMRSSVGQEWQEKLIQGLIELLAELKMDLPFFSPRYLAHMTSDISLPGMLGYYAGLLYHANNVSAEASPVTLKYELQVGRQFAKLIGYDIDTSFGHITSGGTVANFESVFYHKAARFLPITMALAIKDNKKNLPSFLPDDLWALQNIPLEQLSILLKEFKNYCNSHNLDASESLSQNSPSFLSDRGFWKKVENVFQCEAKNPVIIVPATAHYSWSKASHIFGLGRENCLHVPVDQKLSLSIKELKKIYENCYSRKIPIIQTVCILGSTEYGSFDPLDEMILEINTWKKKGLYSPVHIDGAFGGYYQTMFKNGENSFEIAEEARRVCPNLSNIYSFINQTDSFTIDPHKLGHTPYGAGVFITRHGFIKEFVAENADYCLTENSEIKDENFPLGKYIMEGSKPGASAAAVYFSNKLIPLNCDGYGSFLLKLIKDTKIYYKSLIGLNDTSDDFSKNFEVKTVNAPESSLICFYIRPKKMDKLSEINAFNAKLIHHFFPKPTKHIQEFNYFVSKTRLYKSKLTLEFQNTIFNEYDIDDDAIQLMRLVFLNQWTNTINSEGISYWDDFLRSLKELCLKLDV